MYQRKLLYTFYFLSLNVFICRAQFPGYDVQHFNSENGLPNTIKGLVADKDGFVWIATESGLVRFDGSRFHLYDHSETGAPVSRLYNVGLSADGKVFTNVQYLGYHYITRSNTLKAISENELFHNEVPPAKEISENLKARYALKLKDGILADSSMPSFGARKGYYFMGTVMLNGFYYYISRDNTLMVADTALRNFKTVKLAGAVTLPGRKQDGDSLLLSIMNSNDKIFLRKNDTIYALKFSADKSSAHATTELFVGDIPNIRSLLEMPAFNTTIVGTGTDGIYVFKKKYFTTMSLDNRSANTFYAQAPFGYDGVLTSKGILTPGQFTPFRHNFFPYSILKTANNDYYLNRRDIDTFSLCILNSRMEKIREIPMESGGINCMQESRDGAVWIAASGKFLGRVHDGYIKWYERPAKLSPEFYINTFIEASSTNQFWIGGKMGLAKVDVISNEIQLIPELIDAYVRSLYLDSKGTLWIGTYGSGFYALYRNKLVKFPLDMNSYLKYVHSFMPDKSGRLWISTNHGLFTFAMNDLYRYLEANNHPPYYYYFDNTAGMLTNEFNGGCSPAGIVLNNGKFSLPSLNGLVQFFPDSIQPVYPISSIFIDKVIADTIDIPVINGKVTIPSNTDRLRFFIASPYFGNGYNQNIEYTIDGKNDNWYRLDDDYVVDLSNLSKGEHFVVLRKQAGFGKNNFVTTRLSFTVQPAFYETSFFKIIVGLLCAILLYLFYRLRVNMLLNQKMKLEKEVLEKTKQQDDLISYLETVIDELEISKRNLKQTAAFKESLSLIIAHDLQSPLRFLSRVVETMDHKCEQEGDPQMQEMSREIRKTTNNIYQFVQDFGFWVKNANNEGKADKQTVILFELVAELELFFNTLQIDNGNKLIARVSESTAVCTDYQLLKIVLRNLIDNANKHTHSGFINIAMIENGKTATITISDNGEGMRHETLQNIKKSMSVDALTNYGIETDGIGFGYRFIIDFCRMLDLSVSINTRLGEGTAVILSNLEICEQAPKPVLPLKESYEQQDLNC